MSSGSLVERVRAVVAPSSGRRWLPGLLLVLAYVALSLAMDPAGSLGSDTGGKVLTLEVMDQRGSLDVDVGYWAEAIDPEGDLHPAWLTSREGERWVNVTTVPMVLAARPLYALGGVRAALLVPMVGAVLAAYAARRLAERIAPGRGWPAFWLVGLASPMAVYALDLWEHSLGVGLMAWAAVALLGALDAADGRGRVAASRAVIVPAVAAGAALGASATMRTESVAYAVCLVGVTCVALWARRGGPVPSIALGAAAVAGFLPVLAANAALEQAVGGLARAQRATGAVRGGLDDVGVRLEEAAVTTVGLWPSDDVAALVAGLALAAALVSLVVVARPADGPGRRTAVVVLLVVVAGLYGARWVAGPGWVPGLLATWPLAAAGVVLAWRRREPRLVAVLALVPLPLVWAFQYTGGALPQWGGRYVLTSGLLLSVVGVALLPSLDRRARRGLVAAAVAVSALGLAHLSVRSHDVAGAAEVIAARDEPLLVSVETFWLRELGATVAGQRWLSTSREEEERALEAVRELGVERFAYLERVGEDPPPPRRIDGFRATDVDAYGWLDRPWRIVTYERER